MQVMPSATLNVGAGAIFGAALRGSGISSPSVIISQMHFNEFHMLKVFFGASACSVYVSSGALLLHPKCGSGRLTATYRIVVSGARRTGYLVDKARIPSSYGWFGTYDANLVGGLLIGAGMSITGSCPGTALVQAAAGIRSGVFVVLGGVFGAMIFTKASPRLRKSIRYDPVQSGAMAPVHTVQSKLGVGTKGVILAYEAACISVIALTSIAAPRDSSLLHPILGALLLGVAQAVSVVLRFKTIGVSAAYADFSKSFGRYTGRSSGDSDIFTPAVQFALGIVVGSAVLAGYAPTLHENHHVSAIAAAFGGLIMVFGCRLAGGCPSGHGISGLATFSLASFVTVAAIFAGGIGTAMLFDMEIGQIIQV